MAVAAAPYLAYFLPSGQEMIVLLVVGVLLFGRRLPEVGRQVGRAVSELRRGVDNFKREMQKEESIRELRDGLRDGMRDVRRAADMPKRIADVPKRIADPKRLFEDLTDESRATPPPPAGDPRDAS